jgi:hypothetical protein
MLHNIFLLFQTISPYGALRNSSWQFPLQSISKVPTHPTSPKLVKNEAVYFKASSIAVRYQQVQAVVQSVHGVGEVGPL